jgi:hypothetical protein
MEYNNFLETDFEEDIYKFTIKVTGVDYYVSEEDFWDIDDPEEVDAMIRKTKNELPQHLTLEIECIDDKGALEDMIADAISEETGWLNNSFEYHIEKKELVD